MIITNNRRPTTGWTEELVKELNRLNNQGLQSIDNHKRLMLGLDIADTAQLNTMEIQYTMFELIAMKAKDELVPERTNMKKIRWNEYTKAD